MGGSGGGGSSSGSVSYPDYMADVHSDWLSGGDHTGSVDALTLSATDAMEAAHGNSPWAAAVAYDPSSDILAYEATLATFAALLAGINDTGDWSTLFTQAGTDIGTLTDAEIDNLVVADAVSVKDRSISNAILADMSGISDLIVDDISGVSDMSIHDMLVDDVAVSDVAVSNLLVSSLKVIDNVYFIVYK